MLTGKTIGQLTNLASPTSDTLFPVELSGVTYHIDFASISNSYNYTESSSIDWSESTMQEYELNADTTFTFTGATAGQRLTLLLDQKESANITWPESVKWVNAVTPTIQLEAKLDQSFETGGFNNSVFTIVLQPDGKTLVGGNFDQLSGQNIGYSFTRLNQDGSLDETFNIGNGFDILFA